MPLIYKICATCGNRYGTFRTQSKHCSNACRQKSYRDSKQREALDDTKMTMIIGNISLNFVGLNPATDKEKLKADLLAVLEADGFLTEIENFDTSLMTRPFPVLHV